MGYNHPIYLIFYTSVNVLFPTLLQSFAFMDVLTANYDSLQVLMFVCPNSELRFYGCCHPCYFNIILVN